MESGICLYLERFLEKEFPFKKLSAPNLDKHLSYNSRAYQTRSGLVGSLRLNLTAGGTPRSEARSQLSLENSLGAQSALVNLETHAYTTVWHGHHLHYPERFTEEKQPICC